MNSQWLIALTLLATGLLTPSSTQNLLTKEEKRDGWILLFDGKSTHGWMTPKGVPIAESHVQGDSLNPHPCDYMLVYEKPLEDFVLSLDFKISPNCNSGIFVRTKSLTPREGKDVGFNGIEIAIDAADGPGFHTSGAIYDLVATKVNAMKPVGEWNHIELTCDRGTIDVTLNGRQVSQINLDEWSEVNKRPDGSSHKFDVAYKDHPRRGYIGLQDHGSDCWYRNIKLRPLGTANDPANCCNGPTLGIIPRIRLLSSRVALMRNSTETTPAKGPKQMLGGRSLSGDGG